MPRKKPPPRQPGPDWHLREWLKSKDMTQADLMRATGWGKARTSDIVNGTTEYYRDIVNTVAAALNVYPWELLMTPAEAARIKRWRAAFEQESLLRAAEERIPYKAEDPPADRLEPLRKSG